MKKRIIGFVLAVVIAFVPSVAFALSDVSEGDRQAVDTLVELGVLTGYPDGSFKGENTITRAEFTAATIRLIGIGYDSVAKDTIFPDVKADFWAGVNGSSMIQKANDLGIIKGYPDKTFKPDRTVSYAEAVTMIVRALGYDSGLDYPSGYLKVAGEKRINSGITKGNDDGATRSLVAELLYNSLSVKLNR